jgi:type II secretory pathway component GspD/PulD (secretin)
MAEPQVSFSDEGCMIKFIAFQKDSSIRDGLRLLAALCKKNIVPSSAVDGPLTISRLYNVTFEQALDAVLGHGFKYEQDGDFVRVYSADEYRKIKEDPERMVYKVITLYYITAEEAAKLIQPVLSKAAQITTSTAAEDQISAASSTGSSGSGSLTGAGGGDNLALNDMIVLFDYPENIQKAEEVIREIDARPIQVLVEATIMSAILTEGMEFGVDWNFMGGATLDGTAATDTIVAGSNIDRGSDAEYPINTITSLKGDDTPI